MEARLKPIIFINVLDPFQSTRPRGRDFTAPARDARSRDFNPRAPHGSATSGVLRLRDFYRISIHAPRVGRDAICNNILLIAHDFNPRARVGRDRP